MRVLLTGASGFIGRQCYKFLKELGCEVVGICNKNNIADSHLVKLDLLETHPKYLKEFVEYTRADTLLHTAWDVGPGYQNSVNNLAWAAKSLELVKEFYATGGKRVVTVGSCFEYDFTYRIENYPLHENYIGQKSPTTVYGTSKLSMYNMIRKYAESKNLNYAHARVFYLFGPHEASNRLVPSITRSLLEKGTADCSHGAQIRDFMYVEDVADAIVTLTTFPSTNGLFNIGSGKKQL